MAIRVYSFVILAVLLSIPHSLYSQESGDVAAWLHAGNSSFDMSGVGNAFLIALRGDYSFSKVVLGEVGLGYIDTKQQVYLYDGTTIPYLVHKLQGQVQLPWRTFRPYVGLGIGGLLNLQDSDDRIQYESWKAAYSIAVGTRLYATPSFALRGEARLRGMDSFAGHSYELTGGLGWRF